MKRPELMGSVISWGMLIVAVLYFVVALSGYMLFGSNAPSSMSESLPITAFYDTVRIALCVALYQSIIVQFVPAIQIIERLTNPPIEARTQKAPWLQYALNSVVRILVIFACAGLAIGIPKLGLFISLIGEES